MLDKIMTILQVASTAAIVLVSSRDERRLRAIKLAIVIAQRKRA